MKGGATYGKENIDGVWKLETYPIDTLFAKWAYQEYKNSPLGWIKMGDESRFFNKDVMEGVIYRLGYSKVA